MSLRLILSAGAMCGASAPASGTRIALPGRFFCVVALSLLLGACATPVPLDVSQSAHLVRTSVSVKPMVASVEMKNEAPPPTPHEHKVFDTTFVPVPAETAAIVAADLKRYFDQATVHADGSKQRIVVRIERADAYWEFHAVDKAPIVSLFTMPGRRNYFMNVRVSFEVEQDGKVVRTYTANERFVLPDGKANGQDDIEESTRRLIAQYREQFFAGLDKTFTTRYLD
ncbi:hypothetical protein [Ralstonia sp. 1B3]|uniref:hypothetical protein n=1 Tax=Ralstonia sp. 1B3 TaxID=2997421 RepID=UPI002FC98D5B